MSISSSPASFNVLFQGIITISPVAAPAFAPTDIAGLNLWLKADALTGLSDGDGVASWPGSSTGVTATQSNAASKPLYKTGIFNGNPVLRFDGSNDFMDLDGFTSTAVQTLFAVVKSANPTKNYQRLVMVQDTNYSSMVDVSGGVGTAGMGIYAGGASGVGAAFDTSAALVFSAVYNGASSKVLKNGVQLATGTVGTGVSSLFCLGSNYPDTTADNFQGDLAELIIYNSALSDANRQSVEAYLKTKYGTA